ncbi:unnamed protein product [Pleuronectes platessa]|uniref:Uncharacterized protein n=1 Tax=Pleuronectes platessa TaxID=8262 RepID=A0A9N7YFT2_PLEPL|nr:unnamed protein product [Pleuronectes platessa]
MVCVRNKYTHRISGGYSTDSVNIRGSKQNHLCQPLQGNVSHQITAVNHSVPDNCFPVASGVKIIAEPGHFYASSAFTLVVNNIAKKVIMDSTSYGKS